MVVTRKPHQALHQDPADTTPAKGSPYGHIGDMRLVDDQPGPGIPNNDSVLFRHNIPGQSVLRQLFLERRRSEALEIFSSVVESNPARLVKLRKGAARTDERARSPAIGS